MHPFSLVNPAYSLSGFVIGILVGQTGVGGGSLMTPLLVLLFGIHPATAVGTDLLYASATKTVGTLVHGYNRTVDWRIVLRLSAGSLPATIATVFVISHYDLISADTGRVISFVLGIALLLTALALVFRTRLMAYAHRHLNGMPQGRTTALTVITGAILGVLVTISSVGAGAVGVTALIVLYPKLPTKTIVGSDIAHAVPLTLIAGVGHWMLGSVDWPLLASLLTGSIPGIIIGSYLSAKVPDGVLRPILAGVLVLVGGRLVF
jgi:uncharacterized membrane protein YfcA